MCGCHLYILKFDLKYWKPLPFWSTLENMQSNSCFYVWICMLSLKKNVLAFFHDKWKSQLTHIPKLIGKKTFLLFVRH